MRTNEPLSADQRTNNSDSLRIKGLQQLEQSKALYRLAGMVASFGRTSIACVKVVLWRKNHARKGSMSSIVSPKEMGKFPVNYEGGIVPRNRWLKCSAVLSSTKIQLKGFETYAKIKEFNHWCFRCP